MKVTVPFIIKGEEVLVSADAEYDDAQETWHVVFSEMVPLLGNGDSIIYSKMAFDPEPVRRPRMPLLTPAGQDC